MQDPTRLRLDPDSPPDLRAALDAERAAPLGHDLVALRAAVTARAGAGGLAGPITSATLGKGLALLLLLGVGTWWAYDRTAPRAPAPQGRTEMAEPPLAAPTKISPEPAVTTAPAIARAPDVEEAAAPSPRRAPAPPRTKRSKPALAAPAASKPSNTSLAAELALYQEGKYALDAGRLDTAAEAFGRYRARYPQGSLQTEATLGELEALHRAERPDRVREVAKAALAAPALRARRGELWRVLAEAEVMAGRCEAAKDAFQSAKDNGEKIGADVVESALVACEGRAMR